MSKRLPLVALLIACAVSPALAVPGVNINWGLECYGDAPMNDLAWACNSNDYGVSLPGAGGANTIAITCSFALPATKTNVVAYDFYLEGVTNYGIPVIPDWWKLGDNECRGIPNVVGPVTLTTTYGGSGPCVDYFQGTGYGGAGLYSDEGNRAHLNGVWAIGDPLGVVPADQETFAGTFKFKTARTVGTPSCEGCSTPFVWALNYIQVAFQGEWFAPLQIGNPIANQCLTWNGAVPTPCYLIPARTTTWGQVKSLYR